MRESREIVNFGVSYTPPGSGEPVVLHARIGPLVRDRECVGFVVCAKDITESQRYQDQLRNSEWTQAMDVFEDPLYVVDLDDRLLRANQAFFRLVGRDPVGAVGQKLKMLLHPDIDERDCAICCARRAHRDAYFTVEADDPINTSGRPFEVQVRIIRDETGAAVATLMARHDLSRARESALAL